MLSPARFLLGCCMNKQVLKQIKNVQVGDLLRVEWFDASTGKTAMAGPIDTPVKSWGVYLGVFGEKNKHIILAQNQFRMTDHGLYDVDYTAIPQTWTTNIHIITPHELDENEATRLLQSFVAGHRKNHRKIAQRRVKNHV